MSNTYIYIFQISQFNNHSPKRFETGIHHHRSPPTLGRKGETGPMCRVENRFYSLKTLWFFLGDEKGSQKELDGCELGIQNLNFRQCNHHWLPTILMPLPHYGVVKTLPHLKYYDCRHYPKTLITSNCFVVVLLMEWTLADMFWVQEEDTVEG